MKRVLLIILSMLMIMPSTSVMAKDAYLLTQPTSVYETMGQKLLAQPEGSLVIDSDFRDGIEGWLSPGNNAIEWVPDGAGGKDGAIKAIGHESVSKFFGMQYPTTIIPGETYTIEFDVRTESGTMIVQTLTSYFEQVMTVQHTSATIPNTWTHVSGTFTVAQKDENDEPYTRGKGYIRFRPRAQIYDSYYLDNVKLISHGTLSQEEIDAKMIYDDPVASPAEQEFVTFADTDSHWAESTVNMMASNGNIHGVNKDAFEPERKITRAEFVQLMVNSLRMDNFDYQGIYKDVKTDHWAASAIQIAYGLGLIDNALIHDDCFYPETPITRQESADMVAEMLKLDNAVAENASLPYIDAEDISDWAKESVAMVSGLSVMCGFEDKSFRPHDGLTRAEAAQILLNMEELSGRWAFYVDPVNGSDNNEGKMSEPLKTIQAAADAVLKHNKDMKHNIYVYLKGGEHQVLKTIELNQAHSGSNGYDVIFKSYGETPAELVGGVHVNGWELHDSEKGIYQAKLPIDITYARHLYINGIRATRARTEGGLEKASKTDSGVSTTDTFWTTLSKPQELEGVYVKKWCNHRYRVENIEQKDDMVYIDYDATWWDGNKNFGETGPTTPYYMENAYELLDSHGEFYIDFDTDIIYYKPRIFEDIHTADAIVPTLDTLLSMEGTVDKDTDECVHNIVFDGVNFKYTTDYSYDEIGSLVSSQNMYIYTQPPTGEKGEFTGADKYGYMLLLPGSVFGNNVKYVDFYNCDIGHIGNIGLKLTGTVQNCNIERNNIFDVSSNALSIGEVNYGINEDGKMLWQAEGKYTNENIWIINNYIHTASVEYYAAIALSANWTKNSVVAHNEIFDNTAGGMHFGWIWNNTDHSATENFLVTRNYVHDVLNKNLYDSGAIYNVGPWGEPDFFYNEISYNYLTEQYNRCGVMYSDQGSTNIHWKKNVIDLSMVDRWYAERGGGTRQAPSMLNGNPGIAKQNRDIVSFEDNYTTTSYHLGLADGEVSPAQEEALVYPDAKWPQEALDIIEAAGIEPGNEDRFPDSAQDLIVTADKYIRAAEYHNQPINTVKAGYGNEVRIGDEFMLDVAVTTRKNKVLEHPDTPLYFYSRDPDIVTVDETGKVTAVGEGAGVIEVQGLMDDEILKTILVEVYVNDDVIFTENLSLSKGASYTLPNSFSMEYGRLLDVKDVNYEIISGNECIKISEDGKVIAEEEGTAILKATIITTDTVMEREMKVTITPAVASADGDGTFGVGAEYFDMSEALADVENWVIKEGGDLTVLDDGLGTFKGYTIYTGRTFQNEVLEFGIRHDWSAGGGWRCILIRSQSNNPDDGYSKGGYMVLFDSTDCTKVSLQRFNDGGLRTIFYGNMKGVESLVGDYLPSGMLEKEVAQVKLAAINVDNGVRLVMIVDGETIFDIVDVSADRIEEPGYFMFHESKGRLDILNPQK